MRRDSSEGNALVFWAVVLLGVGLVSLLSAANQQHSDLSDATVYTLQRDAFYMRGKTAIASADTTPATVYTTGTDYTSGVHLVSFANPGSQTVYITIDGTTASATNYQIVLPAGSTFTSVTQQLVTTVSAYAASANTIYVAW